MKFVHWLHHLFNPHCEQCALEETVRIDFEVNSRVCQSCETLRTELENSRRHNDKLLNALLKQPEPTIEKSYTIGEELSAALQNKHKSWAVRRQELENADRKVAEIRREYNFKPPVTADTLDAELKSVRGHDA